MHKVCLIGSGGREHALAWKLAASGHVDKVYCIPGNGGTPNNIDLNINDFPKIADFVKEKKIDLVVVGPEDPLTKGIVDFLSSRNIKVFGPKKSAAVLEGSKAFSKEFMRRYSIPTADFEVTQDPKHANMLCAEYIENYGGVVIKADGLAAGKGVFVCKEFKEAQNAIIRIMEDREFGAAGDTVVIEEMLKGKEASIIAFCDGKTVRPLAASQDHKRALDGDKGPNTGGMGVCAPNPTVAKLSHHIMNEIFIPTLEGMAREDREYRGILYAGLMITDQGPKVLEYNVRFGDPETQAILPLLETDLYEIMMASIEGRLSEMEVKSSGNAACCVVMTSKGYPGTYKKGFKIKGLEKACSLKDTAVFHAGTKKSNKDILTNGGRVLCVTATDKNLECAVNRAYLGVGMIDFQDKYYRTDIGKKWTKRRAAEIKCGVVLKDK
ncbi:phosphoribosylamine--glycine ligase [Elusimicrobiota bacterium]